MLRQLAQEQAFSCLFAMGDQSVTKDDFGEVIKAFNAPLKVVTDQMDTRMDALSNQVYNISIQRKGGRDGHVRLNGLFMIVLVRVKWWRKKTEVSTIIIITR